MRTLSSSGCSNPVISLSRVVLPAPFGPMTPTRLPGGNLALRFSILLIENLSAKFPPGSLVGVIGPNGAGKTTLLKLITGLEQPDEGKVRIGETVKLAYADQSRSLDPEKNVWEEISGGADTLSLIHI